MQILRTRGVKYRGVKYHGWGGYLICMIQPPCLPTLEFRYMPKTSTKYLKYTVGYTLVSPDMYSDMPIGMSADTCIQYWEDL